MGKAVRLGLWKCSRRRLGGFFAEALLQPLSDLLGAGLLPGHAPELAITELLDQPEVVDAPSEEEKAA